MGDRFLHCVRQQSVWPTISKGAIWRRSLLDRQGLCAGEGSERPVRRPATPLAGALLLLERNRDQQGVEDWQGGRESRGGEGGGDFLSVETDLRIVRLTQGSDGKRFWRDVSQTSVEDVPLHRQLDHLHMSPSGRARVARLPSQQGQVSTSSIGKPAVLESQPPSPIVTSRSLLKVQMDNLGEAAPIQAMSPGSLRISSLQMQAMTVTAPVPEAMRSTSPKQHRLAI